MTNPAHTMEDELIIQKLVVGISAASEEAIKLAIHTHTDLVVWRNGGIVLLDPDQFTDDMNKKQS